MNEFDGKKKRGGDKGESGLIDGTRLKKSDLVFSALGDIDELSSTIGLAKAFMRREAAKPEGEIRVFETVQSDLVRIGAQIATPENNPHYERLEVIGPGDIGKLEEYSETYTKDFEMPNVFILPGATIAGAHVDLSRAVCRRAERRVAACIFERKMNRLNECQRYLNRLSDLLFILARWLEHDAV
jgi:cob(I)alamin adenosyltransferase